MSLSPLCPTSISPCSVTPAESSLSANEPLHDVFLDTEHEYVNRFLNEKQFFLQKIIERDARACNLWGCVQYAKKNYILASRLFHRSCCLNNSRSISPRNLPVQKTADKTSLAAYFNFGECSRTGIGTPVNLNRAAQLHYELAEKASPSSLLVIATHFDELRQPSWQVTETIKEVSPRFFYYAAAECYEKGLHVQQDFTEAFRLYQIAVTSGYPPAMSKLGQLYEKGDGVEKNNSLAIELYRKAAKEQDPDGMYMLAKILEEGLLLPKDMAQAILHYKKASEKGHCGATHDIACHHISGNGFLKNHIRAFDFFLMASQKKHRPSIVALAQCYYLGIGVQKDEKKAVEVYLEQMERADVPAAMLSQAEELLKETFEKGIGITKELAAPYDAEQNYVDVIQYHSSSFVTNSSTRAQEERKAFISNDANKLFEISEAYAKEGSLKQSTGFCQLAADRGLAKALCSLGMIYLSSHLKYEQERGFNLLLLSALQQDSPDLFYKISLCYKNGKGITADNIQYIKWLLRATQAKHVRATVDLADCYKEGLLIEKDLQKSFELYSEVSGEQNSYIHFNLALFYEFGEVVPKDRLRALSLMHDADLLTPRLQLLTRDTVELAMYLASCSKDGTNGIKKKTELAKLTYRCIYKFAETPAHIREEALKELVSIMSSRIKNPTRAALKFIETPLESESIPWGSIVFSNTPRR